MPIPTSAKVVVQLPSGPLKGFVSEEDLTTYQHSTMDIEELVMRIDKTDEERSIAVHSAKGIFFVKDFDGKPDQPNIRFHDDSKPAGYLWVRVTFKDGEVLEGMIDNSYDFIVAKGIWITPSDPTSNNWLIYALKSHLSEFEVLGMRQTLHRRPI
jgi:hypothetical protein